jgi:hypothetical protein
MHLNDLLSNSPEKLEAVEKLSNEALTNYLAPYLRTTRPDTGRMQSRTTAEKKTRKAKTTATDDLLKQLEALGI